MCHRQIAVPLHYSSFFYLFSVYSLCSLGMETSNFHVYIIITLSDFNTKFLHAIPHNHLIRKLTFALSISPIPPFGCLPPLALAFLTMIPTMTNLFPVHFLLFTGLFRFTYYRFRNIYVSQLGLVACFFLPFLTSRSSEFNVNHINLVPLKDRSKDQ